VTNWPALDRFLATDPRDVGCELAMQILHIYVDLILAAKAGRTAEDPTEIAAARYPGVAAHLAACGPCGDDFYGLLVAAQSLC
jgi:hypothetical protein